MGLDSCQHPPQLAYSYCTRVSLGFALLKYQLDRASARQIAALRESPQVFGTLNEAPPHDGLFLPPACTITSARRIPGGCTLGYPVLQGEEGCAH